MSDASISGPDFRPYKASLIFSKQRNIRDTNFLVNKSIHRAVSADVSSLVYYSRQRISRCRTRHSDKVANASGRQASEIFTAMFLWRLRNNMLCIT